MQADRILFETLKSKHEILTALGEMPNQAEVEAASSLEDKIQKLDKHVTGDETLVLTSTRSYYFFSVTAASSL